MSEAGHEHTLASLRFAGAQKLDPTRFHYLEVLSQRLPTQDVAVRRILEVKLQEALASYGDRFRRTQNTEGDQRSVAGHAQRGTRRTSASDANAIACTPLAQLNQYIRSATHNRKNGGPENPGHDDHGQADTEMASVRRFRETWSQYRVENQVVQAEGRGPENSGPFNSHRLVLQSLALMRGLSPDYLRRFLSHVETLQWLEQASEKSSKKRAKPVRRTRQKN